MVWFMEAQTIIQGQLITAGRLALIRELLAQHRDWGRTRLSEELCLCWNWRNARGRPKDMAARTLLLKLERRGLIELPARKTAARASSRKRVTPAAAVGAMVEGCLNDVRPLSVSIAGPRSDDLPLFKGLLAHHYLGHRNTVGENIGYLIRDRHARPVACMLFGSAAWKCAERDDFIGWDRSSREGNLQYLTNNTRFLILPWVRVPHLASHVLGLVVRRIRADWQAKYGHPVHALETFVDRSRFKGTCYRAANWRRLGETRGRTRNDRNHSIEVPIKDVYLYPLTTRFRRELRAPVHREALAASTTEGRAAK